MSDFDTKYPEGDAEPDVRARARHVFDSQLAERRDRENACAIDFVVYGNPEGRHEDYATKLGVKPFTRDYQPLPYPEALPFPEADYEGTGIGLLYDLTDPNDPRVRPQLLEMAGWSLIGPREHLLGREYHALPNYQEDNNE